MSGELSTGSRSGDRIRAINYKPAPQIDGIPSITVDNQSVVCCYCQSITFKTPRLLRNSKRNSNRTVSYYSTV